MKQRANWLLLGSFLFFCLMLVVYRLTDGVWWSHLLLFVAEASLVGGIADWFAVTALFRKPLGFISFHTELIPRNREYLIQGVANMVEQHLLSAAQLQKQLKKARFADLLIEWVDKKGGGPFLAAQVQALVLRALKKQDSQETATRIEQFLRTKAAALELPQLLEKALRWALASKHLDDLIDRLFAYLQTHVNDESVRRTIEAIIAEKLSGGLKGLFASFAVNKEELANNLHAELVQLSTDLQRTDHPLRILLREKLVRLADQLQTRTDWQQAIREWFETVLGRINIRADLARLLDELVTLLESVSDSGPDTQTGPDSSGAALSKWLSETATAFWHQLKVNRPLLARLDEHVQTAILQLMKSEHSVIGEMVRETLAKFDNEALVRFVEDKVGDDLQGIRVNGSLIGALIGALLYIFLFGIYQPLLEALV